MAAPTRNREYGAYACCCACRAASISPSTTPDLTKKRCARCERLQPQEFGHGLSDVGESGALAQRRRGDPGTIDKHRHRLPAVIRGGRGRVVPVIRRKDN